MSNDFAIATVTATLSYLLERGGTTVDTLPPDRQTGNNARLNLFLYQVTPNVGYRNMDLPARSYTGDLVSKQKVGLDLYYLLTAYGENNNELSAQRILAEAVRVLHESPVLTRELIKKARDEAVTNNLLSGIGNSDLAEQLELVKVTMQSLSLEDLTKIWSSFFKEGSYRISVAYKATLVLLDGMTEANSPMPVGGRNVYAIAPARPEILSIEPQMVARETVSLPNSWQQITIVGKNLNADDVRLDFGEGLEIGAMAKPDSVTNNEIIFRMPAGTPAGINQVRVVHPLSMGSPAKLHKGLESNAVLFALVPKIISLSPAPAAPPPPPAPPASLASSPSLTAGNKLTINFEPALSADQEVKVIMGTHRPLDAASITANSVEVTVPTTFKKGAHPVRLSVDESESQPDGNSWNNEFRRPYVIIV